jgi:hypothetical protein
LPVADSPTMDDARGALDVLMKPFEEFPWCSAIDLSAHLAALLTVLQRRLLYSSPLIAYSAPTPRTGKSALADSVALIGTGRSAPCQAVSSEREEFRKMIFAALLEGHAIVNLDNIERPLDSEPLSIALTQPIFADRMLGQSSRFHLSTRMTWTATGCNLGFKGDLSVRVLMCHIDANVERPEERTFKIPDFPKYLRVHRAELVQAALTILRAYHVADRPAQSMTPWAGFEEWTDRIRAPLVWLGMPDPIGTRASITDDDAERSTALALFHALGDVFKNDPFTAAEAVKMAKDTLGEHAHDRTPVHPALDEAVRGVAERKGMIDRRSLGYWFRKYKGRFVDGMRLKDTGKTGGVVRWQIEGQPQGGMK